MAGNKIMAIERAEQSRILLKEIQQFCPMLTLKEIAICCNCSVTTLRRILARQNKTVQHKTKKNIRCFNAYCILCHEEWENLSSATIQARWQNFNTLENRKKYVRNHIKQTR